MLRAFDKFGSIKSYKGFVSEPASDMKELFKPAWHMMMNEESQRAVYDRIEEARRELEGFLPEFKSIGSPYQRRKALRKLVVSNRVYSSVTS
jgi:hypothetical protein